MVKSFWWIKLTLKLTIRLLPIHYFIWRKLKLFAHGSMQDFNFSKNFFYEFFSSGEYKNGLDIIEIGPGDSLNTALFAHAHGFNSSTLVDLGWQAHSDLSLYSSVALELQNLGLSTQFSIPFSSVEGMLKECRSTYLLNGINSLEDMKSCSIDIMASNAVLEHLDIQSVQKLMAETSRILKPGGIAMHRIDFRDHIFNDFKHLGFSERFSNSYLIRNSGNYLNRLHLFDYIKYAEEVSLEWEIRRTVVRSKPSRLYINSSVSDFWHKDENLVESIDLILQVPKG